MLFVIYIYHVLYSTLDTLLTGLWTEEPCNADGDFLIVPQKGSKSSSSDYLPLVCNVFFCNYFSEKGDVSIFGSTDVALFWHNDCALLCILIV